ncbi:MAG: hypothetical protein KF836_06200 [Fimbriimonadaceae bacterium]|nr:hypothetical protein [Fimbriimonadaceae bacterium]
MEERKYYIAKWKYFLPFLFLLLPFLYLTVDILWSLLTYDMSVNWFYLLWYSVIPAGFLVMIAICLGYLFQTKPAVVISSVGILVDIPFSRFGLIPWGEISHVTIKEGLSSKLVMIVMKDPDVFRKRLTLAQRFLFRFNRLKSGAITFSSSMLRGVNSEELLRILADYSSHAVGLSEQPG